jgi:enamine deaminase RidA (YjgF/YER057c/UK114 family)
MTTPGAKFERRTIGSSSPWEPRVGYSRAVRTGPLIAVAGTTSTDETGAVIGRGDAYTQTTVIFRKIESALRLAGAEMKHVVRTRMFVTDIGTWEDVGRAHAEFFGEIRPAATMVQVSGLIHPDMLVEIEVDAVLDQEGLMP